MKLFVIIFIHYEQYFIIMCRSTPTINWKREFLLQYIYDWHKYIFSRVLQKVCDDDVLCMMYDWYKYIFSRVLQKVCGDDVLCCITGCWHKYIFSRVFQKVCDDDVPLTATRHLCYVSEKLKYGNANITEMLTQKSIAQIYCVFLYTGSAKFMATWFHFQIKYI